MDDEAASPDEPYNAGWEFRMLYKAIYEYDGTAIYPDLLLPWLARHGRARDWLLAFAARPGAPVPPASKEDLWDLYALNRVNDMLLAGFQPPLVSESPSFPITQDEYVAFMTALGLSVVEELSFKPFHHEVVHITAEEDPKAPVQIVETLWPCLMLGSMLFSRAGVGVRAGSQHLRAELAASSALYWTFQRRNRTASDLSHGWGHNSQWRTEFRRDYRFGRDLHLNVDARCHISEPGPPGSPPSLLTSEQRVELLIHRCYVTLSEQDEDEFPYWFSLRTQEPPE